MKPKFTPTAKHIEACETLIAVMALHQTVKADLLRIEQEVLDAGSYEYDPKYSDPKWLNRLELPADKLVKKPSDVHMMQGIATLDGQSAAYFAEVDRIARKRGYVHGVNAEAVLSDLKSRLETALLADTEDIHRIPLDMIVRNEHRRQLVELNLKLLVQYTDPKSREARGEKLYREHIQIFAAVMRELQPEMESFFSETK